MPSRRRFSFPWSKSLLLSKFHFSMSSCHLVPFLFACLKSRSEIYVCHSLWHIAGHLNYRWNETYASASSAVSQQGLHIKGYMNYHLSSKPKDIPSQFSSSFLPSKNPQKSITFPKPFFVTKNVTNPLISLKTQAIWQMILEYVSDVRYVSNMFAPIVNHFGLGGPGALVFFLPTMGSWVSKNPFPVVSKWQFLWGWNGWILKWMNLIGNFWDYPPWN